MKKGNPQKEEADKMNEGMQQMLNTVLRYLQLVTVSDLLDIGITAFLVYKLIRLMRRSRIVQMAKAILLLVAALMASSILRLNVINFMLGHVLEIGILALIIVFQPEIRRLLEQVGSGALGELLFGREEVENDELDLAITQTVAAYTAFSKDKVGALMVFERKTPLDEFIKTGTALKCSVNSELLKNLFWNKAPMHDGAVIVRNGQIIGAGCVLPLSGNVNLSRELGMRHRAGIGMSENSDAVVAIVSEETGSISVAVDGMLKRHLAPETLDRLLRAELMPEPAEPMVSRHTLLDRINLNLDRFKKKEAEENE